MVIVRLFDSPPPEEAVEIRHRVYASLFDSVTLQRLTRPLGKSTIESDKNGGEAKHESWALRKG